jgi:RNA polymerase sigma factor (sigma-70 family)
MSPSSQSLSDAIAGLPEEERIILTMHYLRSMSTGEIAQTLGVPERSVSAIIEQGKARLLMIMGM